MFGDSHFQFFFDLFHRHLLIILIHLIKMLHFVIPTDMKFDYDSICFMKQFEIIANDDGSGILVIDKKIDDEIPLEDFPFAEQQLIRILVKDMVNYFDDMKEMHPANGEFNRGYVDWLNKQPR